MSDRDLKFDGLNLVSNDVDSVVAFYRRLGVDIPDSAIWSSDTGAHHVDVELGNGVNLSFDSVALAREYNTGWKRPGGSAPCVIGFKLPTREAVDERYADLTAAGYEGLQPPYDAFWGARYAIVKDPSGNDVGFMSPVDPERRGAPPAI